tara:strand:+ start:2646 stop:3770 length:1125 start_codon:yes stop_codon:yes gene_type:complete
MENVLMSLFYDQKKGIFSVEPKEVINLQRLIQIYKSEFVKLKTSEIQNPELTQEQKQELKKNLPFITPYSCSTYRSKENVYHLNSNIICLDFDKLEPQNARLLKYQLSENESTILTAISPRANGVKAIIYLPKKQEHHTHLAELINRFDLHQDKPTSQQIENHYHFQKHNLQAVLSKLGITEIADLAQLKVVQPFLIAYDEYLYYNLNAKPLDVELLQYTPIEREPYIPTIDEVTEYIRKEREPLEKRFETKDFNEVIKKRIAGFLRKKVDFICLDMLNASNRHKQICRCIDVLEYLHYLPGIENEIIETLTNGITQMYGSEKAAKNSNAFKSFDALKIVDRKCDIIEEIIKEEIEKQRIETERIANSSKTFAI